ncbi:MAG: hypothetical protein Q4C58_14225 [Eubacteriales bacterium]|nr:hypothetical protein [Eubacteriales bacterium]
MQHVSKAYKASMQQIWRNIGYIKVYIGVVNAEAQKRATVEDERNSFTYFSDLCKPFDSYKVERVYATAEENFSRVDGTMRFLPEAGTAEYFNQGIVTADLLGTVYVVFNFQGLDIKGLTIDFGECYPVNFTVENDMGVHSYTGNTKQVWVTEDVFYDTSWMKITPTKMVNGSGRLRIQQFICGIANFFSDHDVQSFSYKDAVSPITDKLPSQDMSITVDNKNLYYCADNPESALVFMETGQEIQVYFGYDIDGEGSIEWLDPFTGYLKKWEANDEKAKFTATDRFDNMTGKYCRGLYRPEGISLYDLAEDVLTDAQVDSREYFIDPYLKDVIVYNPLPVVKHTEALQIIANAGRCILTQDRKKKISLRSSFVPDMTAESVDQTEFSNVGNIIVDNAICAYSMASRNFSAVDGSILFLPEDGNYLEVGYVSQSVADEAGIFDTPPMIEIALEAGYSCFGMEFRFHSVAPDEFVVQTFYGDAAVDNYTITAPDITAVLDYEFLMFDRIVITFTKSVPGSRVTLDAVTLGNATDYVLNDRELTGSTPIGTREERLKSLSIQKTTYEKSKEEEAADLTSGDVVLETEGQELELTLSKPSYGFSVEVDRDDITCTIVESYSYFVKLKFSGLTNEAVSVKYTLKGYEYTAYISNYTVRHDTVGTEKEWKNQLISNDQLAADLEEWLAQYYLNNITYEFQYRGDPRIDANDLFYLQRRDEEGVLICATEAQLTYKGAWSGKMKARRKM